MADLAALLADPARATEVPAAEVPGVLALVAAEQSRLAALQGALAARLAAGGGNGHGDTADRWLTAQEVAARTGFSQDYLYRHAGQLPFTRRQGRIVRFSEAGLARWMASRPR